MSTAMVSADPPAPEAKGPQRATHFDFRHPVFNVKGGYFAFMRPSEEVGFYFPLGEMVGVTTEAEIARARALMRTPLQVFDSKFAQVDTKTGHIAALPKNVDLAIELIRENRDDLHFGFMVWDALIESWKEAIYERGEKAMSLIKETYRFLATNYAATVPWTLSGQRR